ncbi:MAG TPA: SMC-Scp complex subunit ScpB [Alphaproteobacteria bacterium]|nr:SMC-Scp complex subunit ScpB [Alphaproteobacteria bacterium]
MSEQAQNQRIVEAMLFAATEPLDEDTFAARLPEGTDIKAILDDLQQTYAMRGVNLVRVAQRWAFRTAPDLAFLLRKEVQDVRRLSRAGVETLAIIAYHQPVTRAEIEEIRGVAVNKGTLDVLMETEWVRPVGRRQTPGRPVTYGTTAEFLNHFGLASIKDLPGLSELKAAGLLDSEIPPDFMAPAADESEAETDSQEELFEDADEDDSQDTGSDDGVEDDGEEEPVNGDAGPETAETAEAGEDEEVPLET